MTRTYKNETGSPEIKMRRESPVIGGARFYPGTTISFTEAQWENLPQAERVILETGVMREAYSFSDAPPPAEKRPMPVQHTPEPGMQAKVDEAPAEEVVEETAPTDEEKPAEVSEESKEAGPEPEEGEGGAAEPGEDDVKPEDVKKPATDADEQRQKETDELSGKTEELAEPNEKDKELAEKAAETEPEVDDFDYAGFLDHPIPKVKAAFEKLSEDARPPIEKLIEAEKAGSNRSSLVGWLSELLG